MNNSLEYKLENVDELNTAILDCRNEILSLSQKIVTIENRLKEPDFDVHYPILKKIKDLESNIPFIIMTELKENDLFKWVLYKALKDGDPMEIRKKIEKDTNDE